MNRRQKYIKSLKRHGEYIYVKGVWMPYKFALKKIRSADYSPLLKRRRIDSLNKKLRRAANQNKHTKEEWLELIATVDYHCVCCNQIKPLHKDHIKPVTKQGKSNIENIQPLCKQCNSIKGQKEINYLTQWRINHGKQTDSGNVPDNTGTTPEIKGIGV